VDFRRIGQAVARRLGSRAWPKERPADPPRAGRCVAMQREIDMDMIIVKEIGAGAKHRCELAASAGMNVLQESPRLIVAPGPIADDRNLAPVPETKTANVKGIAKSMFGNAAARLIVHRPAAVGAHRIDFGDLLTEPRPGVRLQGLAKPRIDRGHHRAVE